MSEQLFLELDVEGEDDEIQNLENGAIRKNLLGEFADIAKSDPVISNNGRELMKVFLRIRPFTEEEKELHKNQECMEKDGETAVLLNAPKDSFTSKNEKRGREVTHRFTFSHVFGAETTQKEFFDSTSLDVVKDFMDGQNCLVFTYGVTNSGKTYTIQGTPKDGGVLPRTLDVLFNSIQDKHYTRMNLKPRYFCDVINIGDKQEHMEAALRNGLLMSLNKEHFDLNSFLQLEESNNDTKCSVGDESSLHASIKSQEGDVTDNDVIQDNDETRVTDDTTLSVETQGPVKFSVWVSFAEIYNEQIYDLLEPCPEGKGKKRTTLKLGDDKNGNPYIKGLREICVSSADEAYKILRVGKKNQRIASTKLNQNSSRSHCIFSIKVLRVVNVEDPHVARVSRLSFVDLAGSERYTKTQSTGDRLKESGNINTSLMTLGKCLENLRYNQMHPNHDHLIPFRESKLTRLFQGFFCGKGKASMIVNINQCPNTFDETYHALKFSAIAKQVTTKVSKPTDMAPPVAEKSMRASFAFPTPSKVPRMSIAWENGALATPAVRSDDCIIEEENDDGDQVTKYIKQLENLVRRFESELIEEKKAKATLELKIREEVCSEMAEQLVAIETAYSERIQEEVNAVEDKCDRRIEILAKSIKKTRKRACIEKPDDDDDEQVTFGQLKAEKDKVKSLTAQVKELESNLESMKAAFEESENHSKNQEEVMIDLQTALQTSSKELEIAKLKIDKRDRMLKEKDELNEQLERKLDEQSKTLEDNADIDEKKETKITALQNDLDQHQQALEDNENFLEQLNNQVKQLTSELTDAKHKNHEQEEHQKGVGLETALTRKISKLREQLLARDELMKELVQSLEETRAQVELEKGDLMVICNEQKNKITQLETELEEAKNSTTSDDAMESLKEQLKKAQDKSLNAQEEVETNCFEKEELQLALDSANSRLVQLKEQLKTQTDKAEEMLKLHEEANNKVHGLEELMRKKEEEVEVFKNKVEQLKSTVNTLENSNNKMQGLEELLKNKEDEVKVFKNEVEQLKSTVTTLETSNTKIQGSEELLKKKEDEIEVFKNEVEELKSTVTTLETSNNKMQGLEELLKNKDEELSVLQNEVERLKSTITTLEASNKKAKAMFDKLENEVSKQEGSVVELDKLKQLKTELHDENSKVVEELRKKELELEKVVLQVEALNKKLQTAVKDNEELRNKMSSAEEKLVIFEKEKEREGLEQVLMSEVQILREKLQTAAKENEELKNKMSSAQEKIVSLEKEKDEKKVEDVMQTQQAPSDTKELEKQLKETTLALDKKNSQLISRNNTIKRLELSLTEKEAKKSELAKSHTTPSTPSRDLRTREEIKTLRRRLLQADKDSEEYKQKVHEYEQRMNELNKTAEEMSSELSQAQEKASNLEAKVSTMENLVKDAQEKSSGLTEMIEAKEQQIEVYRLQQDETKERNIKSNEEMGQLKEETRKVKEEFNKKVGELYEMRVRVEEYEKKVEQVKLQHCEQIKMNEEKVLTMAERTKNAEASLASNAEKIKDVEESKEQEICNLQELIQSKEKLLRQKTEELASLKKQFSSTEQEKSDELDKVWKTMVELQDVIKERGQTIDMLEDKLSKTEARHAREKTTLENTLAKIKDVMETKGADRNKYIAQITELEAKVTTLNDSNKKLIEDSEKSEKDIDELRRVLEQQDAVMEEQQEALNERQSEIETLVAETTRLEEQLNTKDYKTENTAAEILRLEGTLSVIKNEKEKLENELKERRKEGQDHQLSKVEISRDFEIEKSDMLVKLEKKEGNISKVKAQVKSLQTEKKALEQKCKEKEVEIKKLDERLQNAEAKQQEYEGLVQLKDSDVRAANEEKDTMLKAMREALAVASSKKGEFDAKIKTIKEQHADEMMELRKQYEVDLTHKMVHGELSRIEETPSDKPTAKPSTTQDDNQSNDENDIPRSLRRTTRARKTTASHDDTDAPTSTNDEESAKENSEDSVLRDITSVTDNSVKILKDQPIPDNRIEIDVTPIQRRKRTSRAPAGSKTKPKKRRSSELPLSEIKIQLSAKKSKMEQSGEDFTPSSAMRKGTRRSTRTSSASSSCSARKQRPPVTPMTPMNEDKKETVLKKQSSIKKKPFFGKLFSGGGGSQENTPPPKRGRKLLKKDISAPMDSFSPCIASISTTGSTSKDKSKARSIITRQLRSRVVKN